MSGKGPQPSMGLPLAARRLWYLAASGAVAIITLWLVDVGGPGIDPLISRTVATVAAAMSAAAAVWTVGTVWRNGDASARRDLLWAAFLLLLALVVRFVGLDFELIDHPRNDEGVYLAASERINEGQILPQTFNYGHFLYYAGAFVLWLRELFPDAVGGLARLLYGLETPFEVSRILLKGLNAFLAACTTLAVLVAARRVAGRVAGYFAALLITFSPLYNDVAHQVISDVPSGFFAALTLMFVSGLLDRENLRDYLLAGIAAGLAAGSKYPGGVAAVAIIGVWAYWRVARRDWNWYLAAAGGVSIAAMLAVMPALVMSSGSAFSGHGLDIFFGFRQYAYGGWLGVEPANTAAWYARVLAREYGIAALLGLTGFLWLDRQQQRRLLLMCFFPVVYLALIGSMHMVVLRNLQPVLPALAIVLGVTAAGWSHRLGSVSTYRWQRWAVPVCGAILLTWPAFSTITWDISRTRAGTRQLAQEWIEAHIPDGAGILHESYTGSLDEERYHIQKIRFVGWLPPDELFGSEWDYLLLATSAHLRFMNAPERLQPNQRAIHELYKEIFERLPLVQHFRPTRTRAGAELFLFRNAPRTIQYRQRRRFTAAETGYISDPALRKYGPEEPLHYSRRWQYAVFKEYLRAGEYRVILDVEPLPKEGYLYVVTPDNQEIGKWEIRQRATIELPENGKYLLRVFLAPTVELSGVRVRRLQQTESEPG